MLDVFNNGSDTCYDDIRLCASQYIHYFMF